MLARFVEACVGTGAAVESYASLRIEHRPAGRDLDRDRDEDEQRSREEKQHCCDCHVQDPGSSSVVGGWRLDELDDAFGLIDFSIKCRVGGKRLKLEVRSWGQSTPAPTRFIEREWLHSFVESTCRNWIRRGHGYTDWVWSAMGQQASTENTLGLGAG